MSNPETMPALRLVPAESILFHEHPESRRTERITARIRHDAQLRNPPIVGDLGGGEYLLLDGANRVSGMKAWGTPTFPCRWWIMRTRRWN